MENDTKIFDNLVRKNYLKKVLAIKVLLDGDNIGNDQGADPSGIAKLFIGSN